MRWFSLDHKIIGLQYAITSMVFLLVGFGLMMLLRSQLAYPMQPIPFIGGLLGSHIVTQGIMLPQFYNQLGAMHGTIMIFLGVVPLSVGGFGNYRVPLQVGAPDMARVSCWTCHRGEAKPACLRLRGAAARGQVCRSHFAGVRPLVTSDLQT